MSGNLAASEIRFGTNGWRGILAEDFTFPRLRRALGGVARFFAAEGGGEVIVAHDTRFLGEEMAALAAAGHAAYERDYSETVAVQRYLDFFQRVMRSCAASRG